MDDCDCEALREALECDHGEDLIEAASRLKNDIGDMHNQVEDLSAQVDDLRTVLRWVSDALGIDPGELPENIEDAGNLILNQLEVRLG